MRLIFINRFFHPDHSATSQILSDLCIELANQEYQVLVVTSRQRYEDASAMLPAHESYKGVHIYRVPTTRMGRDSLIQRALDYATFYISAMWRLWGIARAGDVVVALTDPPLISVAAWPITRMRQALLVNWVQDIFPEVAEALRVRGVAGPLAEFMRWLRDRAFKAAAANIVLSERMAAVVALSGAAIGRICVIPNWADMHAIHPVAPHANPLRAEWGMNGAFVVCYSGNMGRAHEFDTVLNAARLLGETAPRITFLFIGGGAQRRAVEDRVREEGLRNVTFRPYQDRASLSNSLSVGDVHLVSQRPEVEGYLYPSKLYGVLAAGRPVIFIGDAQGEIALLGQLEGFGLAIKQGDAEGLACQLSRLASDHALLERMGLRARILLCERYDRRIALQAWLGMLGKLEGAT